LIDIKSEERRGTMPILGLGPAAWASVGRALGAAIVTGVLGRKDGIVALMAKEIQRAILRNDVEMARHLLRDMQWRHAETLKVFLKEYANELPQEFLQEFGEL
jgi:hypothetical protein